METNSQPNFHPEFSDFPKLDNSPKRFANCQSVWKVLLQYYQV